MTKVTAVVSSMQPTLVRREAGGWLALSPVGAQIQIGVEGRTKKDAERRFRRVAFRWADLWEKSRVRV